MRYYGPYEHAVWLKENNYAQTSCYQCQEPITAKADAIHPLCDTCQDDFGYWFARELEIMNNARGN